MSSTECQLAINYISLDANPCDAREYLEKCSRNSFFSIHLPLDMKSIRLIPNIHVLKQQV